MQHPTKDINNKWHVGKEIPLAMIFALLVQTAGVIWWAASLSGKIDSLAEQVAELKSDKRLQENSFKDIAVIEQRVISNERRILLLESRQTH
jgi:hypothetical protein